MLDQRPEFRKLKNGFNADCTSRWDESVKYFINWKAYLSEIRADCGGHFDHGTARHAIEEMHPETVGELVVVKHQEEKTGGGSVEVRDGNRRIRNDTSHTNRPGRPDVLP
jgi:hypothetical protein